MITGDNRRAAEAIARADRRRTSVLAEVLPQDKADQVQEAAAAGSSASPSWATSINDAPGAWLRLTSGIAIGTGTDVAIEAGNIVLVARGHPLKVVEALALSRADLPDDQAEPVLGVLLQRRGDPHWRRSGC